MSAPANARVFRRFNDWVPDPNRSVDGGDGAQTMQDPELDPRDLELSLPDKTAQNEGDI